MSKGLENVRILVLNADFRPLGTVGWKRGVALAFEDGVNIVSYYDDKFVTDTKGNRWKIPSVLRKVDYVNANRQAVRFTRKNVYIRDNYTCQYCGNEFGRDVLTYDHVVPRSLWKESRSPTHWENVVTACWNCNSKKANRTPEQAGMRLKRKPFKPKPNQLIQWDNVPPEWMPYVAIS